MTILLLEIIIGSFYIGFCLAVLCWHLNLHEIRAWL